MQIQKWNSSGEQKESKQSLRIEGEGQEESNRCLTGKINMEEN